MTPIRILGHSAYRFIEGLADGSINNVWYSADISRDIFIGWYRLSDYARENFHEFLEDVLDYYLDLNIPSILGIGRHQVGFDIRVYLPDGYQFQSDRVCWLSSDEPEYVQSDVMSISVDSRQFRPFRVELPVPYDNIFHNPRDMWAYINRVGRILLSHVRQNDRNSGSRARERIENDGWGGFVVPREHAERIIEWACDRGYEETPEQKRAREIRAEEARVASQKALELLLSHCDEQQRADYEANKWFIVHGRKNRYRIRKANQINVDVLDKRGNVKYKLCTVPDSSGLPIEDQLLAQKTLIELNEKQFLDVAIKWHVPIVVMGDS